MPQPQPTNSTCATGVPPVSPIDLCAQRPPITPSSQLRAPSTSHRILIRQNRRYVSRAVQHTNDYEHILGCRVEQQVVREPFNAKRAKRRLPASKPRPCAAAAGPSHQLRCRAQNRVIKPNRGIRTFLKQIRRDVIDVSIGPRPKRQSTDHRFNPFLARSRIAAFFRSQYSGVASIGSPLSSPSISSASTRSWARRF